MSIILANPVHYIINSISLGDTLITAPVLKYAIDNFHADGRYTVTISANEFKDIFYFIPKDKLLISPEQPIRLPESIIRYFNEQKRPDNSMRMTSMRMSLAQYAAIRLLERILPRENLFYLPLPVVDISHYNVDFSKVVLVMVTHRADNRQWPKQTATEIAEYITKKGYIPAYIGKISDDPLWKDLPLKATFDDLPPGIDLRNKTDILQLASICRQAKAIVGIDSGPIHIAGTTEIPIVAGYTSVAPDGLVPIRPKGPIFAVVPDTDLGCRFCQSNWQLDRHDFATCYFKHRKCCEQMTSDKFIRCLNQIL